MPVLPGSPPLEVALRRSTRARRFSLRVSRLDGRITLTVPARSREAAALKFLGEQEGWLRQTLADMPETDALVPRHGSRMPVEGRLLQLVPADLRAPRIDGETLMVPRDPARVVPALAAFLKALARDRLARASTRHASALGRSYSRLTLRDTRSRWGSCSHDGALMYSWRLIMAPPEILDYVAAHEAAHLVEMNHSSAFWAEVEKVCPDWRPKRAWLHEHGQDLHRWRFETT